MLDDIKGTIATDSGHGGSISDASRSISRVVTGTDDGPEWWTVDDPRRPCVLWIECPGPQGPALVPGRTIGLYVRDSLCIVVVVLGFRCPSKADHGSAYDMKGVLYMLYHVPLHAFQPNPSHASIQYTMRFKLESLTCDTIIFFRLRTYTVTIVTNRLFLAYETNGRCPCPLGREVCRKGE